MPQSIPLIGSAQAAKRFGVHRATFNRWVEAGEIPIAYEPDTETGGRLFDADVIDALVEEREKQATA